MPRTADAIVAELHGVLQASGICAPYVLAAHSLGGLFARLYAAAYRGDVAGMALIDAGRLARDPRPGAVGRLRRSRHAAAPGPRILSRYRIGRLRRGVGADDRGGAGRTPPTDAAHRHLAGEARAASAECPSRFLGGCLRSRVAQGPVPARGAPDARREIAAENDHYVQVEQSELAVEAIRALVEAVRDPSAWRMCRRAQIDALTCVQESDVARFVRYSRWQSSWYILGWYSNEFMRDIEWRNSLAKHGDGRICRSLPSRSSIKRRSRKCRIDVRNSLQQQAPRRR